MPFKSKAQEAWMWANSPSMAQEWQRHTKNAKALPQHAASNKKKTTKKNG